MSADKFLIPNDADYENENVVLCGMLRDPAAVSEMTDMLSPSDFSAKGEPVFRAIVEVWEQSQSRRCDPELVLNLVRTKTGNSADVCRSQMFEILESDPSASAYHGRAQLVRERSIRRQLVLAAQDTLRDCESPSSSADDSVSQAQLRFSKIGGSTKQTQTISFAAAIREACQAIDSGRTAMGLPSGIVDLDSKTGGFHDGELCILAARPGVGKSALAMTIATNAGAAGFAGLILSLEMSRSELATRYLCGHAEVKSQHLRAGKLSGNQIARIIQAGESGSKLPIWVNDSGTLRSRDIRSIARKAKAATNCRLVIVDYLQLITPEDSRVNRVDQVGEMSRSLKLLARDLELPVICLAQLNRQVEQRGSDSIPRLSDLRDSGNIEQDADTVIFLSRLSQQQPNEVVETITATVAKQRNGPIGSVSLAFRKDTMRFENFCPGVPQ